MAWSLNTLLGFVVVFGTFKDSAELELGYYHDLLVIPNEYKRVRMSSTRCNVWRLLRCFHKQALRWRYTRSDFYLIMEYNGTRLEC
jgi:hypothetical protein